MYFHPVSDLTTVFQVFMMFALCNANFKAINILLFRNHFLKLLDILRQPRWSEPRNPAEVEIQQKYSRTTRYMRMLINAHILNNAFTIYDENFLFGLFFQTFKSKNFHLSQAHIFGS